MMTSRRDQSRVRVAADSASLETKLTPLSRWTSIWPAVYFDPSRPETLILTTQHVHFLQILCLSHQNVAAEE
jgi:hypothetical protein